MKRLSVLLLFACSLQVFAQAPSGKQKPSLEVRFVKEDTSTKVHFKLYTTDSTGKHPVRFAVVNLFLSEETKWGMMGNITTDSFGEGAVPLHDRFAKSSSGMKEYDLFGSAKDDPRLEWVQTHVHIKPAMLTLKLYQQDSVHYAKAILTEMDTTGKWVPVPGIKIDFCVQRYYTPLPSAITDENGEALLQVPNGLKGDREGNTKIVARLDSSPVYGTLIASQQEAWGVPDKTTSMLDKLLSLTILIGVWTFIIYIVARLFRKQTIESAKG